MFGHWAKRALTIAFLAASIPGYTAEKRESEVKDPLEYGTAMLKEEGKKWTPPKPVPQPTQLPGDFPLKLESVAVDPLFDKFLYMQEKGWLGSDVAHSIPLSGSKILWLFGDTFYGEFKDVIRTKRNHPMINNCVGIQDISGGLPGTVTYHQGGTYEKPASLFPHSLIETKDKYYNTGFFWPTTGFMYRGKLFIFAYDLRWGSKSGFEMIGAMLRIDNPLEPPEQWHVAEAVEIKASKNTGQMFHTAFAIEEPYIYCLGYSDAKGTSNGEKGTVLARVYGDNLIGGRINEKMQFWATGPEGPHWSDKAEKLVWLYAPSNTESGVQYEKAWGMYIATTYEENRLYITTAEKLTGPWTKPALVYITPQQWQVPFRTIAYAMRPHPEFSSKPGELVISYATNATDGVEPLFNAKAGAEIYFPRFLRVQVSKKE